MNAPRMFLIRFMIVAALTTLCTGCASSRESTVAIEGPSLVVLNQQGGAIASMCIVDDLVVQAHGDCLVVRRGVHGVELNRQSLARGNDRRGITRVAAQGRTVYAIRGDSEIVTCILRDGGAIEIDQRIDATSLGMTPTDLRLVHDEVYVIGDGGVVRLSDMHQVFSCEGIVGSVVDGSEGLVATIGRRLYRCTDSQFVGSASLLHALPQRNDFLFVRANAGKTTAGVMGSDFRERDAIHGSLDLDGQLRGSRQVDNAVWIFVGERAVCLERVGDGVRVQDVFSMQGIRDLLVDTDGTLYAAHDQGVTAMVWDSSKRRSEPGALRPLLGRIDACWSDGRDLLCWCGQKNWRYDGNTLRPSESHVQRPAPANQTLNVATTRGNVQIVGGMLQIRHSDGEWETVDDPLVRTPLTLAAIKGYTLVATEDGVVLVDPQDGQVLESIAFGTAVTTLLPRSGAGVYFACRSGRVGVLDSF